MESLKNKNGKKTGDPCEHSGEIKRFLIILTGVIAGLIILFYDILPYKIVRSNDVSLPYHWWLLETYTGRLSAGDYIEFVPPVINDYTRGKLLVKEIVCAPKDFLATRGMDFYCNGRRLGSAVESDRNGKPANRFTYEGGVPDDSYFVMGTHPRSYDSRYFGFVRAENIRHRAFPL